MLHRLSTLSPQELRRLAAMCGGAALLLFVALFVSQWQIGAAAVVCSTPGECRQDGTYASIWADEGVVRLGQGTTINWESNSSVAAVEPSIACFGGVQGGACGTPLKTFTTGASNVSGGFEYFTAGADKYLVSGSYGNSETSKIFKWLPAPITEGTNSVYNNMGGYTSFERTWSLDNGKTVTKIGNYNSPGTVVVKIGKRNSAGNYDVVLSESCTHPGGGWYDCVLSTPFSVPSTGDYYVGAYSGDGPRYYLMSGSQRAYKPGNIVGTNQSSFTESSDAGTSLTATYQETEECFGDGNACGAPWQNFLAGASNAAGWRAFTIGSDSYLAVGNNNATSKVYKLTSSAVESSVEPNHFTSFGNYTVFDRAWKLDTGKTVDKIGVYLVAAQSITPKIAKRNSAGNYSITDFATCAHPGGGWFDCDIANYTVPADGDYYTGFFGATGNSFSSNTVVQQSAHRITNISGANQGSFGEGSYSPAVRATYTENLSCFGDGVVCGNSAAYQEFTSGANYAHGIEYFTIGADNYLSVANNGWLVTSKIYKWMPTVPGRSGGAPSNSTIGNGYTMADLSWKLDPGATVTKLGFYATNSPGAGVVLKILRSNGGASYTTVVSQACTSTVMGWNDCTLTVPYGVPLTGSYYVAAYNVNSRVMRGVATGVPRIYIGSDSTGTQTFNKDNDQVMVLRATYQTPATTNCFGDGFMGCGNPWQEVGGTSGYSTGAQYFLDGSTSYVLFSNYSGDVSKLYALTPSSVNTSEGTLFGDMNNASTGGLGASFDDLTNVSHLQSSQKAGTAQGYVGKSFSSPKRIAKAVVYGSNNLGYKQQDNNSVTVSLRAKNGTAPTAAGDGVLLGSVTFNDTGNESVGRTITSSDTTTTYGHVWIRVESGTAGDVFFGEIKLYEAGGTQQCFGDGTTCGAPYQSIAAESFSYPRGAEYFEIDNIKYVAFPNTADYSRIYKWTTTGGAPCSASGGWGNGTTCGTRLQELTALTDVPGGFKHYQLGTYHYLAAGLADSSKVYRWIPGSNCFGDGLTCGLPYQTFTAGPNYAAPGGFEYFNQGGENYLAAGNTGNYSSQLYRLIGVSCFGNTITCGTPLGQNPSGQTAVDWETFATTSNTYLLRAASPTSYLYQWMPSQNCIGDGTTCSTSSQHYFKQSFSTSNARDWTVIATSTGTFAAVSDSTSLKIYKWTPSGSGCPGLGNGTNCTSVYQTITAPRNDLQEGNFFSVGNTLYLSYGWYTEPASGEVITYKWTASGAGCPAGGGFGNGTDCTNALQTVSVGNADDPEKIDIFVVGSDTYLWTTNLDEGNSGNIIYKWTTTGSAPCSSGGAWGDGITCGAKYNSWTPGHEHGEDNMTYTINGTLYGSAVTQGVGNNFGGTAKWIPSLNCFGDGTTCGSYYSAVQFASYDQDVASFDSRTFLADAYTGGNSRIYAWTTGGTNCLTSGFWGDGINCAPSSGSNLFQTIGAGVTSNFRFFTDTNGGNYLLRQSSTNAEIYKYSSGTSQPACTLYGPGGVVLSTQSDGTYETPAISADTTYTLTCNTTSGGQETVAITLTVSGATPSGTFTYKNSAQVVGGAVAYGEQASLDWNISNADSGSCGVAMGNPYLATSTVSAMGAGNARSNVAIGPMALSGRHFASLECLKATLGTNNGILFGGVTKGATGPSGLGEAYTFDGVDDYVNATGAAVTSLQGESSFTVSFWAKRSSYSLTARSAVTLRQGTSLQSLLIYPFDSSGGNGARVYYNAGVLIDQNNGAFADGSWHHFLFVSRSATDHELYVDGVSVGTSATSKTLSATLSDITIGAYHPTAQFFDNSIDDVRVYTRPLSSSEIATLASKGPVSAGLVGYWSLNDLQSYKTTAYDSSQSMYTRNVTVNAQVVPPDYNPSLSGSGVFDVLPKRVRRNSTTNITWNVTGLVPGDPRNSCTITASPASALSAPLSWDGQGTSWVNIVGVASGPITSRTTFTLTCVAPDGVTSSSNSVDATLLPTVQEI